MSQLTDRIANLSPRKRALLALRLQAQQASESNAKTEPIAVVGIGCRFPGNSNSANEFWQTLVNGVDAVDDIPGDRWDVDRYYDPTPSTPGKMNTRWGGFINDIDKFDAAFFGISPREADSLDPQQRLLLEVTWEALEHAGQATDKLSGSQTGVFIGICRNDYGQMHGVTEDTTRIDPYFGTGNTSCFASGRLSYMLGLHGPSLAVDTACSSSLVAVHLAVRSLRAGECRMALAGGVNLILSPWPDIYMSQLRTLATDGRCKAFDDRADGYVRGEGCGIVVLKRLSDALADNDNVLAVIRGSAVNQDGRSAGITAPNGPAQEAVIRSALTDAQMDPREVTFVEAHGTGTPLGDPIEIRALASVFDEGRDVPLLVGSVKSNLGHLEAAAGVAAFIKLVLTVQHGEIPKQLHYSEPSSYIPWKDVRVAVPRDRTPWPLDQERRVGAVSSFGFSGTNAHMVVEEWREDASVSGERDDVYVLPLSARDPNALRELAARYVERLAGDEVLSDLCYSAAVRRSHHRYRVAVLGRSAGELRAQLESFLSGECAPGVFVGKGGAAGVVYVFSGQGAQWWGMGRELAARVPEFRATLVECDELFAQRTQDWRLLEELERGPEESRLDGDEMDLTQCALFALQVSLARLWTSYGVRPTAVVGHSMGEAAAAVAAGVLSLAEGVAVIYERSRLLRRASGRGAMLAVELSEEEAVAAIKGFGPQAGPGALGIAAVNGKRACVVSGEREAVHRLMRELEAKGVMVREVRTSGVAAHSAQVADQGDELVRVLGGMRGRASEVRLVSTVSGRAVAGEDIDANYWGRNLRQQVRFRAAMQELAQSGNAVYIEMSAHPVLGLYIREALEEANKPAPVVAALRRERSDTEVTLSGLAELYAAGVSINWEALWRGRAARYVPLPAYPWQRRRFWIEPRQQSQILTEADLEKDPQRNRLVESLIQKWGREGVLAVNRRYLAPFIFLSKTQQSLFYFNLRNRSIVGLMYVGPDDQYGPLVKELREYCESKRFQLNLIATESGTPALKELGFTTTPCGALQSITDLKNFTLDGNKMRRLRYLVQRYQPGGRVVEYKAGSDRSVDDGICGLIDNWIETRKKRVPFSATLKDDIRNGRLDPRLRLFLTYNEERLDSVVVISPAVAANGYLLDLEFYREDGAQGCLEFTIVEVIRTLAGEGREFLSLGGSFGTQLTPHPNADAQVEQLFATLHDEQILNGDGNFQFKSKFRPETSQLYLCLPKDSEHAGLADVLTTLAGDGASEEEVKQLSSSLKVDTPQVAQHARRRSNRSLHPLLGEKLHLALNDEVFQSYQSIASLSFLSDHAVGGIVVMPGTAYVEMGLAAAQHALGPGAHLLVDLSVQQVMAFPEADTETTVQLTLKREDDGASFRILSETDSGQWLLHATGTIRTQAAAPVEVSFEAIRSRCTEEITGDAFYQILRRNGLEYGPSFQGVKHVWRRDREALGQVQLPESQSGELRNYRIHPALLDACFQVFEATIDTAAETDDAIYLLRGAEEIAVYGELPKRIFAHAVLRDSDNRDLYAGDLMLYGESERPVAAVKGIYAKRVTRSSLARNTQKHLSEWLYEIRWQLSNIEDAADIQPRAWVIFCNDGEFGKNLETKFSSLGQPCFLVHSDTDYDRVLNEAALAASGVPLGIVFVAPSDVNELESVELGCRSVLNLIRSVIETNLTGARLWLITRGAQSIGTETVSPAQSALWGMGRVIAAEYPETFGGLIDLDAGTTPSALFGEIVRPADGEDQIVYRADQRYVARLTRSTTTKNDPVRFKESATYLITGGLGALGFECAGWMIERGARHIALASRGSISADQQIKISQWVKQGATIRLFRTDVTKEDQIKDLITGVEQSMPPLKGIIHAVGVVEDGMAHKQSWEQFRRVLDPKVRGAYPLHLHTRHLSLDFFTLFSSAASMFGTVGQINHAAANAFLDGLAQHRKAQGLPGLSINWGAWSQIGEAAKQHVPEKLASRGIDAIEPEQGWLVFEMIFNHPSAQVGVLPIDWQRWQRLYTGKVPPLMAQLMQQSQPATQPRRDLVQSFFSLDPNKQQARIEEYLVQQAARVLRMDPSSLDLQQPLINFGLDSIMTVELRDRIDAEWQVRVPLVEFFREPTIARLSSIMLEQLRTLTPVQQSSPTDPIELLNRLDQMSETEMDKLLDVMLSEQDGAQPETAGASA